MKKNISLTFALAIIFFTVNAQKINYTYDANGNRIARSYESPRLTEGQDSKVENGPGKDGLTVYPNPATDEINISIPGFEEGSAATVSFYDAGGKLIFSSTQRSGNQSFGFSAYPPGMYFLEIHIGTESMRYRFQKN